MPNHEDARRDIIAEQAAQGVKIDNIEKTCKEIKECLLGNGKPGLVLRTDRLEQKDQLRSKMFWVLFSGLGAVLAKMVADMLGVTQ